MNFLILCFSIWNQVFAKINFKYATAVDVKKCLKPIKLQ